LRFSERLIASLLVSMLHVYRVAN